MIVLDSQTPQHSPFFGREVCAGMDRAAVIPNDQIARLPDMFIDKFRFSLMSEEELQNPVTFVRRQAYYFLGHQFADKEG